MLRLTDPETEFYQTPTGIIIPITQNRQKWRPKAFSFFSGAGGMDVGFIEGGFEIMGFWRSAIHKARKAHKCIYCGKVIQVGEEYSRQVGVDEGDFHNYCLCLRCLWLVERYDRDGYLTDIWTTLYNMDFLRCPKCGSYDIEDYCNDDNKQNLDCECYECDEKWVEDISLEGLKRIVQSWRDE